MYRGKPRPGAWALRQKKGLETPEPQSHLAAWRMPRAHLLLQWEPLELLLCCFWGEDVTDYLPHRVVVAVV